jgi:hypothetical protein
MTEIRKLQIWAHQGKPTRRFDVLDVSGYQVRGWVYDTDKSATRTRTLDVADLVDEYVLLEDAPAHLQAAPLADRTLTAAPVPTIRSTP